jgi:hypothetical protein
MHTLTIDRIVELWPTLSEETKARLIEIAERCSDDEGLLLTAEEEALLEQSREDFREGRVVSLEDLREDLAAFIEKHKIDAFSK